jgi:hypothetical protein
MAAGLLDDGGGERGGRRTGLAGPWGAVQLRDDQHGQQHEARRHGQRGVRADDEDVRVVRGPLDKPIVYKYDFDALVSGKGGDIELAPGDVVFVTDHWVANVGEVINRVSPLLAIMVSAINTYLVIRTLNEGQ